MFGVAHQSGSSWRSAGRKDKADKGPTRWDYEKLLELQADVLKRPDRAGRVRMALECLATLTDTSALVLTRTHADASGRKQTTFDALCRRPDDDGFEFVSLTLAAGEAVPAEITARFGWSQSPYFDETIRPFGVDLALTSRSRTQDASSDIGCAAYSEAEYAGAGRRERDIHRLFGQTVAALLFPPEAPPAAPASPVVALPHLPPRFVPVLDGLLAGDAPKQIARKNGLSLHTTYEYTKQLYRRLNVSGRGELLALFVRR